MSSVIGVVLLVAIVTVLASAVGYVVLDFGDEPDDSAPAFAPLESYNHRTSANGEYLNVTHQSGESIAVNNLTLRISDAVVRRTADDSRVDAASLDGPALQTQLGDKFRAGETLTLGADQFAEKTSGNAIGAGEYLDLGEADILLIWNYSEAQQSQVIYQWHGPEN